jgi:hypothetical protein
MHPTIEAIIEPDGEIRPLEPIRLRHASRALITILEDETGQAGIGGVQQRGTDVPRNAFDGLIDSLARFPDDFMSDGREQPDTQDREGL